MALIDIKKLRPHWKGEFAANVAYLVNDVVIYSVPFTNQRNIYICKTNSIGNLPSDTNFFDIMVQNIVPLDQIGEIYYYSTSVSPEQNVALSPPNGVARIEMTGSIPPEIFGDSADCVGLKGSKSLTECALDGKGVPFWPVTDTGLTPGGAELG